LGRWALPSREAVGNPGFELEGQEHSRDRANADPLLRRLGLLSVKNFENRQSFRPLFGFDLKIMDFLWTVTVAAEQVKHFPFFD
jgi:hypothetical protein